MRKGWWIAVAAAVAAVVVIVSKRQQSFDAPAAYERDVAVPKAA
ncbi:MAG: hypothetical protein WEB06_05135 [Actinomycetota bacterium]